MKILGTLFLVGRGTSPEEYFANLRYAAFLSECNLLELLPQFWGNPHPEKGALGHHQTIAQKSVTLLNNR